jgi:hypothetical protein
MSAAISDRAALIAPVAFLVASLVRPLVLILLVVLLLIVVAIMGKIILAFTHPLLILAVVRIIIVMGPVLWQRRSRSPKSAAGDTGTKHHCQNPDELTQFHSHARSSLSCFFTSLNRVFKLVHIGKRKNTALMVFSRLTLPHEGMPEKRKLRQIQRPYIQTLKDTQMSWFVCSRALADSRITMHFLPPSGYRLAPISLKNPALIKIPRPNPHLEFDRIINNFMD